MTDEDLVRLERAIADVAAKLDGCKSEITRSCISVEVATARLVDHMARVEVHVVPPCRPLSELRGWLWGLLAATVGTLATALWALISGKSG